MLTGSLQRVSNSLSAGCFSLERVLNNFWFWFWFEIVIFVGVFRLLFWWNGLWLFSGIDASYGCTLVMVVQAILEL